MKTLETVGLLFSCVVSLSPLAVFAGELDDLVTDARATVTSFASDPEMQWLRDHVKDAKGVLVIPRLRQGGLILGGSGGSGVLLARDPQTGAWSYPAFYTLSSVSIGAQIGGAVSEVLLLLMTPQAVDSMLATSLKLGAGLEVAAGPTGSGRKTVTADMVSFSRMQGLFSGATVEGAILSSREGWNEEYYNQPARPIEILRDRKVKNPQAESLREEVTKLSGGVPAAGN